MKIKFPFRVIPISPYEVKIDEASTGGKPLPDLALTNAKELMQAYGLTIEQADKIYEAALKAATASLIRTSITVVLD